MLSSTGDLIKVRIQLHSILRRPCEDGGAPRDHITLTLSSDSAVRDVLDCLHVPEIDIIFALNDDVVDADTCLHDGDHLALIPAVGGGSIAVD